jgi:hypothetical protein
MLDAFTGVTASQFDLTFTDAGGRRVAYGPRHTLDQLRPALPGILQAAAESQHNIIVRRR